jgi:NADH-quinone oxidoreductase subunit C
MENNDLFQELNHQFPEAILSEETAADMFTLVVEAVYIKSIIRFLKEKENFIFLTDLCGIHYPNQPLELGVVYHLHNLTQNKRIRLKTFVAKSLPLIESIVDIFSGANWMERETFDFYGITFSGHPKLERILNVEYMDYFPMRKEYPLEDATRTDKDDCYFGR